MRIITYQYPGMLADIFNNEGYKKIDTNYYYWSTSNLSESKNAIMKNNILTIDLPGYEKEDVEVEFDNNTLSVYLKDDDITKRYIITGGLEVENASMKSGQLVVKFKKKVGTKIEIS